MKKGVCRHFNGLLDPGNESVRKCDAGVCYRKLVGGELTGWWTRAPCLKQHKTDVVCEKYEEPSDKEVQEYERGLAETFSQMDALLPVLDKLRKKHKGQNWTGAIDCPVCGKKSTLYVRHAKSNGHMGGKCTTPGCVSWVE